MPSDMEPGGTLSAPLDERTEAVHVQPAFPEGVLERKRRKEEAAELRVSSACGTMRGGQASAGCHGFR